MQLIKSLYRWVYWPLNKTKLSFFGVQHGRIIINGPLLLVSNGTCVIDHDAKINSGKYRNIIGGDTRSSIVVKKGGELKIGSNFRMSNSAIYCHHKIEIGENVMIGGSCKIWDSDFHPLSPRIRRETPNLHYKTAPVKIGDNVFIGGHSIILKGVTIGENAVIGAGSVVSSHVPANEIWGGNPARFIKKIQENE